MVSGVKKREKQRSGGQSMEQMGEAAETFGDARDGWLYDYDYGILFMITIINRHTKYVWSLCQKSKFYRIKY